MSVYGIIALGLNRAVIGTRLKQYWRLVISCYWAVSLFLLLRVGTKGVELSWFGMPVWFCHINWGNKCTLNLRRAADRSKNVTIVLKMLRLLNCITIIWNNYGKSIQISTNMSGIGLVMREIIAEIWRKKLENLKLSENTYQYCAHTS